MNNLQASSDTSINIPSGGVQWSYMILVYAGIPALIILLTIAACILWAKNRKKLKVSEVIDVDSAIPEPILQRYTDYGYPPSRSSA